MKRVLIVSYYFPPYNAIGALRIGKFAKFLPQFGWEPWVLTLPVGLLPGSYDLPVEMDESHIVRAGYPKRFTAWLGRWRPPQAATNLGTNATPALAVRRSSLVHRLSNVFTVTRMPDRAFPWYWAAMRTGLDLTGRVRFDALLSSHGPAGSHIVASWIARRKGIPWVADYRDMWSLSHVLTRSQPWQAIEEWVERSVVVPSHCLTTVSPQMAGELKQFHRKPVTVVTNGFDEEDYKKAPSRADAAQERLILTFTGTLSPKHMDPGVLFEAIAQLRDEPEGGLKPDELQLRFFGSVPSLTFAKERAVQFGVERFLDLGGSVPYHESIRRQQEASVLLLFVLPATEAKGVATGKLFEYLGARRPILAIGPRGGFIEAILQETNAGVVLQEVQPIKAQLSQWMDDKLSGRQIAFNPDAGKVAAYSRANQARQMALVLDGVVNPKNA